MECNPKRLYQETGNTPNKPPEKGSSKISLFSNPQTEKVRRMDSNNLL